MKRQYSVSEIGFVVAISLALRLGINAHAQAAQGRKDDGQVTFNRDIAPIVLQTCARCHRPGESGPFPLLTYDDVRKHARQIEIVTRTRFMPPWLPEAQAVKFADEPRLSDQQIATIKTWVEEGAPEGNPADLPPQPKFVEGWQLGQPDLVLEAATPYLLPASGTDLYWNFIFPVPIDRTRWVRAVEIRPATSASSTTRIFLSTACRTPARERSGRARALRAWRSRSNRKLLIPTAISCFGSRGTIPYVEAEGMALRLDKGTDLVLNVHLQPSGKPETLQPTIGLYFTDQPATKFPMLLQLQNDGMLDIPAGEKNFVISDRLTLPIDVDLLAIYPHAHYLGKEMQAIATLPDGSAKTLIHIPQWNLNWQAVYRYAQPIFLPKGTTVSMRYTYDNSEENVRNPNYPPERVRGGNRSRDEMAHLWLQILPRNFDKRAGDPRMQLQEALARHDIRNNPADFAAHYNLASMLQARGNAAEAIAEYQAALHIRPQDATANNALGAVLIASGESDRAMGYLQTAARTSPEYFDAHYNLGNALASAGDFPAAAEQFAAAVRIRPEDADAHANLGSALAELGRFAEAKAQFERALAINPGHALALENLQQLRSAMGNH